MIRSVITTLRKRAERAHEARDNSSSEEPQEHRCVAVGTCPLAQAK